MLSKQSCPHTGVVNYFSRAEPHFSVGSIAPLASNHDHYCWRVYDAHRTIAGIAADMKSAERRLRQEYHSQQRVQ